MSKYEKTLNDCIRVCPYCGDSYQVEGEDYSEDEREETCGGCGKNYIASESFSVTHYAKPDCGINGLKHEWETSTHDSRFQHCQICEACELREGENAD